MSIGKKQRAAATRLPPELLLEILSAAGVKVLSKTSLVHSSWRYPSQFLLQVDLSLPNRRIAKRWLQVSDRKCWSRKLTIPVGLDTEDAWSVLEGVDGLWHLALVAQESATGKSKFEIELLEASSLRGPSVFSDTPTLKHTLTLAVIVDLKSLRLTAPFSETIHSSISFIFPFHLATLFFKGLYSWYPDGLLHAIVTSSATSITTLDLDTYGSQEAATRFFETLLPLAPRLEHIELHGSDRTTAGLLAFLTACTNLTSFSCWEAKHSILSSLAPTVRKLQIGKNYVFHSDVLYDTLLTQSGVLDHVKLIRWSGISRASLKAQRGGNELLGDLEEKEIGTEFGVETQGNWYGLGL